MFEVGQRVETPKHGAGEVTGFAEAGDGEDKKTIVVVKLDNGEERHFTPDQLDNE